MKKYLTAAGLALTLLVSGGVLAGCGGTAQGAKAEAAQAQNSTQGEKRTVKVGLTGTIYEDIWKPIASDLAAEGIEMELVQFSDFSLPNQALASGDIDLNAFQHHAFFADAAENNGYELSAIGDTFVIAMNLYSDKINDVSGLKDGDKVAIPNDASNGGRALRLLESAGIVTLKADAGANPTLADVENLTPKIEIKEVGAADLPVLLPDVAAAVINGNYALDYGINPENAIYKETEYADDRYFCLIASRTAEKDDEVYKKIVERFQSDSTKKIFEDEFKGYFVPVWEK